MKTDLELQLALAKMLPEKIHQRKWLSYGETGTHENVTFTYIENGRELCDDSWLHVCWLIEQDLHYAEYDEYVTALRKELYDYWKARGKDVDSFTDLGWLFAHSNASWQQRATALIAVKGEK